MKNDTVMCADAHVCVRDRMGEYGVRMGDTGAQNLCAWACRIYAPLAHACVRVCASVHAHPDGLCTWKLPGMVCLCTCARRVIKCVYRCYGCASHVIAPDTDKHGNSSASEGAAGDEWVADCTRMMAAKVVTELLQGGGRGVIAAEVVTDDDAELLRNCCRGV